MSAVHKVACPSCRKKGNDKSGDNLIIYADGGAYCFACGYFEKSDESRAEELLSLNLKEKTKSPISKEEANHIQGVTGFDYTNYRGINKSTREFFRVRSTYSDQGEVDRTFYPVTLEGKLSGYKVRHHPKDFMSVGKTGKECDLFGQFKFASSEYSSWVVLCGGEEDAQAAWQMMTDYSASRGKDYNTACVSPTIGENGVSQIRRHYDFFNKFNRILLCYDNDPAGKEAAEKTLKALPKGKVWLVELPSGCKDPNHMLLEGKQDKFIKAIFQAKRSVPAGVLGSDTLFSKVLEEALTEKIPLPSFCPKLNWMTAGGIPLGRIVNLGGRSGEGKTSIVNEFVYDWIFSSPHKIGIVSMELSAGQYGQDLLSRHLKRKIALIADTDDKVEYIKANEKAAKELFTDEWEQPRFHLVDDRDGSLEDLKSTIEELVVSCDCKVLILDPLQDVLDGLGNEEQASFMKWQKSLIKSHNVTFININHLRKTSGTPNEQDYSGSSTIFKSGAMNLMMWRDKDSEEELERNVVHLEVLKCRWTGRTGNADDLFYEIETHTIYNKQWYMDNIYEGELDDGSEASEFD